MYLMEPITLIWDRGHYRYSGLEVGHDSDWRVANVAHGSAADRAGIKVGDVVDRPSRLHDLLLTIGRQPSRPGERYTVSFARGGKPYTVMLQPAPGSALPMSVKVLVFLELVELVVFVSTGLIMVLLLPTRMTWGFYLFALTLVTSYWHERFFGFLPSGWYVSVIMAGDVIGAAGVIGFLVFCLRFPNDAPVGWRRRFEALTPYLCLGVVAPFVYGDLAFNAIIILPTNVVRGLNHMMDIVWLAIVALGVIILVITYFHERGLERRRIGWVLLGLICAFTSVTAIVLYWEGLGANWMWIPALFLVVLPLAAAYYMLRSRIIDIRFVVTRAAAFAAIGYAVILTLALLNVIFATQIAHVGLVIPLEFAVAVLLGFRLSGLQDASAALALADIQAPAALARGDCVADHDLLARALARAERTRNDGLIATVRAHSVFSAWFMGDDSEFERHARALVTLVGDKPMRGLRHLARCASGLRADGVAEPRELPAWAARAHLVACGGTDDVLEAQQQAGLAVTAADASASPFLQAIARIAFAEFLVEQRDVLYQAASAFCKEAGLTELEQAVRAVSLGKKHIGMLASFVHKRLRTRRTSLPTLDIRFSNASVRALGQPVELRERELALLLVVAQAPEGIKSDRAADQLWPELDGDAARNVLRQTLHRLRKALGDNAAVLSSGPSYRLRDGALVDLWEMRAMANSKARPEALRDEEREQFGSAFNALRAGHASRPTQQEWFIPIEREITQLKRDVGRRLAEDALQRGSGQAAGDIARALIEDDPLDEMPRGLAIRAYLAVGDRGSAVYEYNQYVESMAGALDNPSADLVALVAAARSAN